MFRSTSTQKKYSTDKIGNCPFCNRDNQMLVKAYEYFNVIKNKYPYKYWDTSLVEEHLLIAPKRHIDSIINFTEEELKEYQSIEKEYSDNNYEIFFRPAKAHTKSIEHFHTHAIKLKLGFLKFFIFINKPFFTFGR